MMNRLCFAFLFAIAPNILLAESLETQSNPVQDGAIVVMAGDAGRAEWDELPGFEYDDDFVEFYPIDIDRVQVAHDSTHLYVRIEALEWDTEETWRIGTYIDTDQDVTTGYTGDFLPLGADYFLENSSAFLFTAGTQAEWGWAESGSAERDQSDMLDIELSISRLAIGNPESFDFILYANNFCCDFQMPDDIYPNEVGGFFTYEFGGTATETQLGDCTGDGIVNAADLECVSTMAERDAVLASLGTLPGDVDGDGLVAFADFLILSANFGTDLAGYSEGNIDLTDGIAFADFLILSSNFGKAVVGEPVPEPSGSLLIALTMLAVLRVIRQRLT